MIALLTALLFTATMDAYGRDKTAEEKRRDEEERKKKKEERLRKQREFHNVGNAGKHDKKAFEAEKNKAAKQAMAAALAVGDTSKKKKEVLPMIPAAGGKERAFVGKLSLEMLKIDPAEGAKKVKCVVLTTKSGQRVVFSPDAVNKYSLAGLDPRTLIGKEVTTITMASPRKVGDKPASYVHKIKQMTRNDMGMFDDLE